MNASMASLVGSRISAWGSNGLASRQCFNVGRPFFRRDFDVVLAGGVQRFGVPPQCSGFLHRALNIVAERAGPIHRKARAQLVADLDVCSEPETSRIRGRRGDSAAGLAAQTAS